jgi:hypothetical protein
MANEDIIKVVKNFLSEDDMKLFRDYEDHILETKQDKLVIFNNGNRPVLQFGRDLCHEHHSHLSLEIVSDIEDKVRDLFAMVENKTKEIFEDLNTIWTCSFWFAKQLPGAQVLIHEDTDNGLNLHFKYSAVIYLNTLKDTGQLVFPDLDHSYKPEAGDIVIFKSIEAGKHFVDSIDEDRYTLALWMTEDKNFAI